MAHTQGSQGIKNALLDGVASIEHGRYLTDELIELMIQREVYLVPTLVAPPAVLEFAQAHPGLLSSLVAAKAAGVIEARRQSFRRAVEAGVRVAMGTDSGLGKHRENARVLLLLVENGMTPMQAIVASTANAARLLHIENQLGSLEVGKLADVVVVDGDVLADISTIADPAYVKLVLKGGQAAKNSFG